MNKLTGNAVLASTLLLLCQGAGALDFREAYELAVDNDPEIKAAAWEYQSVLATRSQSSSALYPQVTIDVFAQQVDETSNAPFTIGDYDADGWTLTLTQSIYNHDLYLRLEQTDLVIASSALDFAASRQELILRIARAYFDVLAAEDNLAFARAEKTAIGEQLQQSRERFEVGLIAITDVKESQAQYDLSIAQEIRAVNSVSTRRETLRSIIGVLPQSLDKLAATFPLLVPEPADIDAWVETAKASNLALQSARYAYDVAAKQVSIDRSGHYPSLDLNLSHDDVSTDTDTSSIDSEDTAITLNLSIPVYSGGLTSARTKQALAQQERARFLRDKALRDTIKLGRDSYLGVNAAIAQVEALRQALVSTQTAYEATQAGFEAGTRTAVEVLSVLREQYRAERDYAQARYDYILNVLELKQAAGILSADDVVMVNQWLVD